MSRKNERRIVEAFVTVIGALRLSPPSLRDLIEELAIGAHKPQASPEMTAEHGATAEEAKIAGAPLSSFPRNPHVDVGRGRLLDGPDGPQRDSDFELHGATARVLAHLLVTGCIDAAEVIAYQVRDGSGTVCDRLENARSTISKTRMAIKGLGVCIPERDGKDRHETHWTLERDPHPVVTFSVDIANEAAQLARELLDQARFDKAASAAIEAIKQDTLILQAHEILCAAALKLGSNEFVDVAQLKQSRDKLTDRVTHLERILQIIANSSSEIDGNKYWDVLPTTRDALRAEGDRLKEAVNSVNAVFGPLLDRLSPDGDRANKVVQNLRHLQLGVDRAMEHPLASKLFAYKGAQRLRDQAVRRLPANCHTEERNWVNAILMMNTIDPAISPDIRAICIATKYQILQAQDPNDGEQGVEAQWARVWDLAKDRFYTVNGSPASDEDVAKILHWPWSHVQAVRDWQRVHRPFSLEYDLGSCDMDNVASQEDVEDQPRKNGRVKVAQEPFEDFGREVLE